MPKMFKIQISDQRAAFVYDDIVSGSEPKLRFYAMVAASTILATLGLIMNSTAVVIGAMRRVSGTILASLRQVLNERAGRRARIAMIASTIRRSIGVKLRAGQRN